MNNKTKIIREWKDTASSSRMKYNKGFVQKVEEWVNEPAADYRGGEDVGMEMESKINEQ